ncbi:hypothetical protein EW145_g2435 [Phellinidium pouzarii]|uniref:Uncharacterized protein n=1 Tax=Phellinidium pouzarii TaxID=167371 RepID=A0A4S4LB37_9AGAM|nr:hypothetical protein EW145_g2435 [Phellinidium pouzarii]
MFLAAIIAAFFVKKVALSRKVGILPPSPPCDPFIGNARFMPLESAWKVFAKWSKTYGDVIFASVLGRPMLVVNSVAAARDLLEKKGAIYSDRPRMYVLGELMGWSNTLPFLSYGERFRTHRRMMHQYFSPHAVKAFRTIQSGQVHDFLRRVLIRPENFRKDVHRLIAGSILMATYDHEVTSDNDPYVSLVNRTTKMTTDSGSPGGTFIDLFPALRHLPTWFPGMGLKRHALSTAELVGEVMEMPLREIKEKRNAGSSSSCFVNYLLDEYESSGKIDKQHEEDIRHVGAVIYSAAVETTEATLASFFLLMTLSPEVVRRAQEEIDLVVGLDRLPTIEDRPNLPYLECIVKEVFRFNPAVPISIPHQSMKVDTYRGWTIPAGSMIIPNIWFMMRDERYYPEPERFNPDRFLSTVHSNSADSGEESEAKTASIREDDPSTIVFGFGRRACRMCPGRHFAEVTVWLTYACFLASFNIGPYVNPETGKEEPPDLLYAGGTSSSASRLRLLNVPPHLRNVQHKSQHRSTLAVHSRFSGSFSPAAAFAKRPPHTSTHLARLLCSLQTAMSNVIRRKLVIVGDAIFENYVAEIRLDGKPVQLALWDTAGQEEYERLRPLSYSKSHVIMIAFAIDTPDSLENVIVKWIEEVRSICGQAIPVLLVGCKSDLRPPSDSPLSQNYVQTEAAEKVALDIGARHYKECSALQLEGVDDVFEAATRASMLMRDGVEGRGGARARRGSSGGGVGEGDVGKKWGCCVVC